MFKKRTLIMVGLSKRNIIEYYTCRNVFDYIKFSDFIGESLFFL